MNRTPQTANRDERLDILAGTRGDSEKRAVRLSEIPDLVAATAAGMIERAFPNGQLVARVNFNGTGTVAIRSAANVASITDNGTGDYTVNFAPPMVDDMYVAFITGTDEASAAPVAIALPYIISQTASALRFRFSNPADGTARADKAIVNVAVFR